MKVLIGLLCVLSLAACSAHVADRDASGQALSREAQAAECERRSRMAVTTAPGSTPAAGTRADIERDIRWQHYRECMGLR